MKIFLDTSALIKLYHHEKGTSTMDKIFDEYSINEVFLSELSKVEFKSAVWKKVRTRELNEIEANDLNHAFEDDFEKYSFVPLNSELINLAGKLIEKYGTKGLRTLDSIQLATSVIIQSKISRAITFDDLLRSFLLGEGIKTES